LDIPGLLSLATRDIAYQIKGKTPEEVREYFGIPDTWTEQELDQVSYDNVFKEKS
jgi:Skp1 family, dimerisation domain